MQKRKWLMLVSGNNRCAWYGLFDIGGANYRHGKKTDLKWLLQLRKGIVRRSM
jgi:hypothetical protein